MGQLLLGIVMVLMTMFGLVLASGAVDFGFKLFAWLLIAFGMIMIFALINDATKPEKFRKHS